MLKQKFTLSVLANLDKLFPHEFNELFWSGSSQDLTPAEYKALDLRLFLEMAFARTYLQEKSSRLWPGRSEQLWIFHAPKPLRKLDPDFYAQLLAHMKNDRTTNRAPIAF